jgi:hypothetical protein
MFTLFDPSTGENNQFLRLDRLSTEYFFVGAHGNTGNYSDKADRWIEDHRTKMTKLLDPSDAAMIIAAEKSKRGLAANLPIFLMGCNTGTGKKPFAQEVSKILPEDIYAINGLLVVDQLGISRTGHDGYISSYLNYGNFEVRRFRHGEEVL